MNSPFTPEQIVLIWHGVKMPQDVSVQADIFRSMHPHCKEDIKQGYCSCCGYNFIMNVFSSDKNGNWCSAQVECPRCGTAGTAEHFEKEHKKMSAKTKGGCLIIIVILCIIIALVKLCAF